MEADESKKAQRQNHEKTPKSPPEGSGDPDTTNLPVDQAEFRPTISVPLSDNNVESGTVIPTTEGVGEHSPESRIGTLIGKYRINTILGTGGMGIVYGAFDSVIERDVAIKLLSAKSEGSEIALKRMVQEARAVGQLQHPNVVCLFDVDQADEALYLVMELVEGGTVADLIALEGAVPWERATQIIADACSGLVAAHENDLIHRDVKPENIMLTAEGTAKISDFGLAKELNRTSPALTQQNHVLGTPHYMSPEQCRSDTLDCRSDIYSLGATYFDLLTGRPPFSGSTDMMQVMFAQCNKPTPDPGRITKDLPDVCRGIVEHAMAKDPADRYQSAAEMLNDLSHLLENSEENPAPSIVAQILDETTGAPFVKGSASESDASLPKIYFIFGAIAGVIILLVVVIQFFLS